MWMVIAAVLAILLAAGAGFLTWRLTTGKTGKGSAGRKVHISRKGAYVDDGNLGGKSGELFRGTLWNDDGTVMTEQGYGWGTGQERGRREISLKSLSNGRTYQANFSREILLGREVEGKTDSPVISLAFPSVSRQHCRILLRNFSIYAEDLKSSYGTYINGKKTMGETELHDGDMLQLGYEKFIVSVR